MAKLEAEVGTSPESEKESSSENIVKLHEEARKPRRLKTIVKVSVAAAAIAVMVVAMGNFGWGEEGVSVCGAGEGQCTE